MAAVVAARLSHSAGLPALLVFLGIGMVLGDAGLGIRFDNRNWPLGDQPGAMSTKRL